MSVKRTDGSDHTGDIATERDRRLEGQCELRLAGAQLEVERVQARCLDRDKDVAWADLGFGSLGDREDFGTTVAFGDQRLHGAHNTASSEPGPLDVTRLRQRTIGTAT